VIDLVDLRIEPIDDVVPDELEAASAQVLDVLGATRIEIVNREYVMALIDEARAQMRSEKARAAGNENASHALRLLHGTIRSPKCK
jgi:hypothetical protein